MMIMLNSATSKSAQSTCNFLYQALLLIYGSCDTKESIAMTITIVFDDQLEPYLLN